MSKDNSGGLFANHSLEIVLLLALVALLWQLGSDSLVSLPSIMEDWTQMQWIAANASALLLLSCVRWGPDLWTKIRGRNVKQEEAPEEIASDPVKEELQDNG